jgi:hypothetical protein
MNPFRNEINENGIYKELYVCYLGTIIYKRWFVKGQKTQSRTFHEDEGLTHLLNKKKR